MDPILAGLLKDRGALGDEDNETVLEQYKLYVEMADRISARRQSANTYFLSANSLLVTLSGVLVTQIESVGWQRGLILALLPLAGMALCWVWYHLLRSYRQLNTGKFKVIHEIESLLPLAPYDAEWKALGSGEDRSLYWPFTHVEKLVPMVFGTLYAIALALTLTVAFTAD